MGLGVRIARYIGVREEAAEAGYKVFLDLLGHVIARVGGDLGDAGEILGMLGIRMPRDLLKEISKEVRGRVGILGGDEITRYQEMLIELLAGRRGADHMGSSVVSAARLASTLARDLAEGGRDLVIGDLFIDSGLIARGVVEALGPGRVSRVWGLGVNPLASLAAYASLIDLLGVGRVSVVVGDPFEEIHRSLASGEVGERYRSDLVISYPLLLLDDKIPRERLPAIYRVLVDLGYGEYVIKRRLRLSAASMILAHSVLRDQGVLIAIVPAYILYKVLGAGVRIILRDGYRVAAIVSGPAPSFSGRGFLKEVVIAAQRIRSHGWRTAMVRIDGVSDKELPEILRGGGADAHVNRVCLRTLWGSVQDSWIHFFPLGEYDRRFLEILEDLMDSGRLVELRRAVGGVMVRRGITIRAPGFFVLPNRRWGVRHRGDRYTVIFSKEDMSEIEIGNEYLLPVIRRSKMRRDPYSRLVEQPAHYILSIPPRGLDRVDRGVVRYIEWGMRSRVVEPVVRIYGAEWYSYVYREISSKNPTSDLFVSRAVWGSARMQSVNAMLTSEPAVAGDSFYAVVGGDRGLRSFLTIWFNSTFFLYMFTRIGRILDQRWGMFSSDDFLSLPIPRVVDRHVLRDAEEILARFSSEQLPPLWIQLSRGHRVRDEIDSLVSTLLGLGSEEVAEMRRGLLKILP